MVPPLEAEEILTYIKKPSKRIGLALYSKLYVHSNVVQKKRVAWILFFKIRPSQDILKIRDGTPLEAEGILTYIKNPRNGTVWHFYSKLYVPSNVVQKKGVTRILFFKIRPSQEILKIHDVQKKRVAQILLFKIRLSQEILKNRDGTPLDAEEILTYIKKSLETDWFVARILFFKIRPSQEILKIHDGTPLEAEEILTYIKRPSQEILKNCDGTPLEAEEILTYIKNPRNGSVWHFSSKLYVPSNVVQKKRVARILFFKIRPSQEILKIHDGTPLELDVPSNIVQKKRVAQILLFKIRLSQEILKNRDGTPLDAEEILTYIKKALETDCNVVRKKRVARILFSKIRPSQEILKNRDGTPLEAEEILTYIKDPRNGSV
ncbi:hypothetical protein OROHE_015271 [Orobanche hederae]